MIDPTGLCSNADQLAKDDMLTETMSQCPGCGVIFHGASFMDHLQAGDSAGAQHYGRLFAQEALSLGRGKGFGGLVGRASRTYHDIQRVSDAVNNCFVAGTLVSLGDGTLKPIEQIQIGDRVTSRDPATGRTEVKTVTQTYSHPAPQVLTLTFSEPHTGKAVEAITCTPGHPFYVEGVGFVLAGELGIGTQIVTRAGPSLTLTDIEWHKNIDGTPQGAQVYNFTVADDHTYFVGETYGGVWVHNDSLGVFDEKNTNAVLFTNEGQMATFSNGNADPQYANYSAAAHAEGKAALWIRKHNSTGGTLYHNNTNGTCGYCNSQISTLLPEGAKLRVISPPGAVPNNPWARVGQPPYVGNSDTPRPNPRLRK